MAHRGFADVWGLLMAGWFRFSADAWPLIAEALTSSGNEWPFEAMVEDLVYFEDRQRLTGKKRLGRGALRKRWNCTDYRAKQALQSDEWRDRFAKKSPENRQETAKKSPAPKRAKLHNGQDSATKPPRNRQKTAKKSPHARLFSDTDTDPEADIRAVNTKAAQLLADWQTAAEFWRDEVNPALGRQKRIPTAKSKVGRRLRSEIKANGLEAVLDSFRWLAHGQKWHARQQRANETTTLVTPLRHVEEWAEHWQRNGSAEDGPSAGKAPKKSMFEMMKEMTFDTEEPRMK